MLRKCDPGEVWDEGFQFIGRKTSREQHCASMIDCSCAVIKDGKDGSQ